MFDDLFKRLKPDTVVLTPNRRLAIDLRKKYASWQSQKNIHIWPNISFLQLTTWSKNLWDNSKSDKILLNNAQEQALWEKIISESVHNNNPLLNISATAHQAKQAWDILKHWLIDLNWSQYPLAEDASAFKNWAGEMQKQPYITQSAILTEVLPYIETLPLPKQIVLAGFEEIDPQTKQFLATLPIDVIEFNPNQQTSQQYRTSYHDQRQELISMALWAKQCHTTNPKAVIGCIVPNLTNIRSDVAYIFNKINGNNFDISAGIPLSSYPVIYDALKIITWRDPLTLISSPFIDGAESEFVPRALLKATLNEKYGTEITPRQILALAKDTSKNYHCPILAASIDKYLQVKNKSQTAEKWRKHFSAQLQCFAWPNNYVTNEQIILRWQELLAEFSSLELVHKRLKTTAAQHYINNLANNTIFQIKEQEQPIKILGLLEAAGLNFDHLWLMNVTAQQFPAAPNPNPFIPIQLQRKFNLPHATANRELEFSKALLQRFNKSAQNIIYSYPRQNSDQTIKISPLIADIKEKELSLPQYNHFKQQNLALESIIDNKAKFDNSTIHGGATIFKLQAACPFRAFAEIRLNAKEKQNATIGLNYQQRGQIVHSMLEKAWNIIGSHEKLCQFSPIKLEEIVNTSVNDALNNINITPQLRELEEQRLKKLLNEWLIIEKDREPFQILAQEKTINAAINKLNIKLRVDRIDKLEDGTLIIIDYKTGNINTAAWFGPRPEEPQLPLYCITSPKKIHGIYFAQIKNGSLKLIGKSNKTEKNWPLMITDWQTILNKLARDFYDGNAAVDPKDSNKTCRTCKLQAFCRIKK